MASPRDTDRIKKFAEWLRQALDEAGYKSQRQFSIASAISTATISRIFNYKQLPDDETIIKIAQALEMPTTNVMIEAGYPVNGTEKSPPEEKKPKELLRLLEQSNLAYDGLPLTEDDKEKIRLSLEALFYDAKAKNKRKKSK